MTTEKRGRNAPIEIHFYCDSVPFSGDTIELRKSLGGSESAMIMLAKGLARRGNTVVIYTKFDLPEDTTIDQAQMKCVDGVYYFPNDNDMVSSIIRARQPEVFVSLRHFPVMNWADLIDVKLRLLWNEDLLKTPGQYLASAWQTDAHAFVSDYQREQYVRALPDISDLTWTTVNPVDCDRVFAAIEGVERDPKRLIHISRPERALVYGDGSPLLEVFRKMRQRDPELTLGICRYHSMYEQSPGVASVCKRADELVEAEDGVEWLGELGKDDLYKAIAGAALMLYPGIPGFAETGCVAATEAQLCQTPLIATNIGALPETLHPQAGRLIDGDSSTGEYQAEFVNAAMTLLETEPGGETSLAYRVAQSHGLSWATTYDMAKIAEQWESKLLDMFAARFKARPGGVFKRLAMQDDLRSMRELVARNYDDDDAKAAILERDEGSNDNPDSFFDNAVPPSHELANSPRFRVVNYALRNLYPDWETRELRIVNYAAGNGSLAAVLLKTFPCATVLDVDYSQQLLDAGKEFIDKDFEEGAHADRYFQLCGSMEDVEKGVYDLVVAGEIAEHYEYPETFIAELEQLATPPITDEPGGFVFLTVPQGAFAELMHRNSLDWTKEVRGHRFCFEKRDIEAMVGHKPGFDDVHARMGETLRSTLYGHFLFRWQRDDTAIGTPDIERKIRRMRPRDTVAVCMIAKDNENDIVRALKSVDTLADEIWVADTGSTDATKEIALPYTTGGGGVFDIGTCPDAPPGAPPPGDFGWARNESIKHTTADWILWIDTDEALEMPEVVARYLTDSPFNGLSLKQCHVMKDAPYRFDRPIRMFRRVPGGKQSGMTYTCQGVIHEHFQPSMNELIQPALQVVGGDIIHLGYINERLRRVKCEGRNIPLLMWDREKNPDRVLGSLLEAREYANYAKWEIEDIRRKTGNPHPRVERNRNVLLRGLAILSESFFDPSGVYWEPAFEVYQDTLRLLDMGSDFLVAEFDPQTEEMVGTRYRFATSEHHAIYVADVLKRIAAHGVRPEITWGDDAPKTVDDADDAARVAAIATHNRPKGGGAGMVFTPVPGRVHVITPPVVGDARGGDEHGKD